MTPSPLALSSLLVTLLVTLALALGGCSSISSYETTYHLPNDYKSAMTEIRERVLAVDRLTTGSRFEHANIETRVLVNLAGELAKFIPSKKPKTPEKYTEYLNAAADLLRLSHWIKYYVNIRRKTDAHERLDDFIVKYNWITRTYGPGTFITLRSSEDVDITLPENYRSIAPRERVFR